MPRISYSLESLNLSDADFKLLEGMHKTFMRSIISLPIRVAITSLYIVGSMPIEAYVAKNRLNGRSSMALNPPLKYIMYRHLAMKKTTSNSWL